MNVVVIGGGSIGTRHLKNLKELGITNLALVEPNEQQLATVCAELSITGFSTIDDALAWQPKVAIVASPNHLHVTQALHLAHHNCHLFIEKPLSHTDEGLELLAQEIEQRNLISLVGCNMRFHPGPAQVKRLLDENAIGQILSAQVCTGSYLPQWRPHQDYRQSYSAKANMGGGCILDCIHEIDLTRWYLGDANSVFCLARNTGTLGIETEDVAILICQHTNQAISEIHLDYVQRTYERGCRIIGEHGSVFWNFVQGEVRHFDARSDTWHTYSQPSDWQINQMYVDEMRHFIDCVEHGRPTAVPVSEAIAVMNIVFAAKHSVQSSCQMTVTNFEQGRELS